MYGVLNGQDHCPHGTVFVVHDNMTRSVNYRHTTQSVITYREQSMSEQGARIERYSMGEMDVPGDAV